MATNQDTNGINFERRIQTCYHWFSIRPQMMLFEIFFYFLVVMSYLSLAVIKGYLKPLSLMAVG